MNKILSIILILICVVSCASVPKDLSKYTKIKHSENLEEILDRAEANSTPAGSEILKVSRSMISNQDIIVGGCWDYINTVFNHAGFLANQRVTIFKSKLRGPYVNADKVLPGDWLYFVNHSYNDTEHSAIFVAWIDEEKKTALMVSYVGGKQKKPALYKEYTLTNIYNVIRAQD
jgi:hypothetical protein